MIDTIHPESGLRPRREKLSLADPRNIDRLPPHSIEAEQGVLGCLLLSPQDCIGEIVEKFKTGAEVFYDLPHQEIFKTLLHLWEEKSPIDLITVHQHLKDRGELDNVGGLAYLNSLPDAVPSAANLSYYADIIFEKYILRKMIRTCTNVVARAYEHEGEVDALIDEVERDIHQIVDSTTLNADNTMKALVKQSVAMIQECFENKGALTGVPTGFIDLDRMTSGLQKGEMIVIAARPSLGKTSIAMNIAEHVAVEEKLGVGVFSLEMTSASLVMRMLCSHSRVNLRNIRDGFLSERDFPKIAHAAGLLSKAPLYIDDTPGLSILQLRAKARRMHQQYDIKLFVIDYLQLLHSTAARSRENRQQEVADISSGIKALAKELQVPIIVLSQLNREMEKDKNRKPMLSDLRESGAIEQDADLIGLLYKPQRNEDEDQGRERREETETDAIPVNLLIAKQRNGPTGDVPLTFLKNYTRFESQCKVSPDDHDIRQ